MSVSKRRFGTLAILFTAFSSTAFGVVPFRTVALPGQRAPGTPDGVRFHSFTSQMISPMVRIDDHGHVAFRANLLQGFGGVIATNDTGIWSEGSGTLLLVAREGFSAPGTPAGAVFSDFDDQFFWMVMSVAGQTAFVSTLTPGAGGVTSGNNQGIWSERPGPLTLIARTGFPAPTPDNANFTALSFPVINATGQTAFGGTAGSGGIWSEGSGVLALVARGGDIAPDTADSAPFSSPFGSPVINRSGHTAFTAMLVSGVIGDGGVWTEATGALKLAARTGLIAPETGGALFRYFDGANLSEGNYRAFRGELDLNSAGVTLDNRNGIWADIQSHAGTPVLVLVARAGDPAPDTNGAVFSIFNDPWCAAFHSPVQCVAFLAQLKLGIGDANSTNSNGIWANPSGQLRLVAREGDHAPGTPAGASFNFTTGVSLGINSAGRIAFSASLSGNVTSADNFGIWAQDAAGVLSLVARTGDLMQVAPGDLRTVSSLSTVLGSNRGGPRDFNNIDQIAFWASFTDGSEGIFVTVGPDSDGDGINDAIDGCPNDPNKSAPGQCGCGVPDTDSDGDGVADCNDQCPNDPAKTSPGVCGCGVSDADTDGDGILDCHDNCVNVVNPDQADTDGDGVGDDCDNAPNIFNPDQGGTSAGLGAPGCGACGNGTASALPLLGLLAWTSIRRSRSRRF